MSCYCIKEIIANNGAIRDAFMYVSDEKPQGNYCYQCHTYQSTHVSIANPMLTEEQIIKILDKCPRLSDLDVYGCKVTSKLLKYILESNIIGTRHYNPDDREHIIYVRGAPCVSNKSRRILSDINYETKCTTKRVISM